MGALKVRVGGSWVDVGSGIDEVYIGTDDPIATNPTAELWYDSDAPSSTFPPTFGLEAAKPTTPTVPGTRYFASDTKREWLWDGTGWIIMSEPVITTYVPTVTAGSGTYTTLGARYLNYQRCGGWLDMEFSQMITTNGTAAAFMSCTLPVAPASPNSGIVGFGRENQVTGNMLVCQLSGLSVLIMGYNNAYPGGNGYNLSVAVRYRISRYS